jgi:hypothetical protein
MPQISEHGLNEFHPGYNFTGPVPLVPKVFFTERQLIEMLVYAAMRTTEVPGNVIQRTIFDESPEGVHMGRWTLHIPDQVVDTLKATESASFVGVADEVLPDLKLSFEDWSTDKTWIWILTGLLVSFAPDVAYRLGQWPD